MNQKNPQKKEIKELAEADLEAFIRLVHPHRVLGAVHIELIRWWTRDDAKTHQLVLLPRDHMKSTLMAYRVAWEITKNPTIRVFYLSSTANLAQKQLKFIKDILTSSIYRKYWPEMVNFDEGRREKWTETEISVDHPARKAETIRDPTIFTGGLTTNVAGLHCDIAVLDDAVVKDNAYTEEGRNKVKQAYSLLASVEASDAREWVVGTRYFVEDLYYEIMNIGVEQVNEEDEVIGFEPLYEVFERKVENAGDGTGEFLWPRQTRADGKVFGFDATILRRKKAQYLDKTQFRAQYYNEPHSEDETKISRDNFQYYNQKFLTRNQGRWYYKTDKLNIFAAIDFAYSLRKQADYTAIVVVGVDSNHNYYVLDIDRFKTDEISTYFSHILNMHRKWDFRRLRAEITSGQSVIVKDLKQNYIQRHGLALSIDEHKPMKYDGSKEERITNILQNRYRNNQIWHYQGGNCQILEEELVMSRPPHDDVKDALASAIDVAIPPSGSHKSQSGNLYFGQQAPQRANRFGGFV